MVTVEETIEYAKEWIQNVESSIADLRNQLISDLLSVWPDKQTYVDQCMGAGYGCAKYFYEDGDISYYSSVYHNPNREENVKNLPLENLIFLWNDYYLHIVRNRV